jgi:hypothetical protein
MNLDTDLMYDKRWKKRPRYGAATVYLLVFALVLIVAGHTWSSKEAPVKFKKGDDSCGTTNCHTRHMSMQRFFERKGSPDPARMATAVLETKRPKLMAKMAIRESGADPKAVGDGGKSKTAFQMQERHWSKLMHEGKASKDPVVQALDSERILEALLAENNGNLRKALNAYNGDITRKVYAKNILSDLEKIP